MSAFVGCLRLLHKLEGPVYSKESLAYRSSVVSQLHLRTEASFPRTNVTVTRKKNNQPWLFGRILFYATIYYLPKWLI